MNARYQTHIVFTVVALLPATFQALRPELALDPIALMLALAIALAWLVVLFRSVRGRRWRCGRPQMRLLDEVHRRHRNIQIRRAQSP